MHTPAYRAVREAFGLLPAWRLEDLVDDELAWSAHACEVGWSGEASAPFLGQIVQDEFAGALWLSEEGSVFAAHDGGVDVILALSSTSRDSKRSFRRLSIDRADKLQQRSLLSWRWLGALFATLSTAAA